MKFAVNPYTKQAFFYEEIADFKTQNSKNEMSFGEKCAFNTFIGVVSVVSIIALPVMGVLSTFAVGINYWSSLRREKAELNAPGLEEYEKDFLSIKYRISHQKYKENLSLAIKTIIPIVGQIAIYQLFISQSNDEQIINQEDVKNYNSLLQEHRGLSKHALSSNSMVKELVANEKKYHIFTPV